MKKKDKTKLIIAIAVFGSIGLSYFLWGKEISKYFAAAGFVIWLCSMYFLNKR